MKHGIKKSLVIPIAWRIGLITVSNAKIIMVVFASMGQECPEYFT